MTTLEKLVPILYTEDIPASIDFYLNFLGFSLLEYDDEDGWASLQKDAVELMFSRPNTHFPFEKAQFTGTFYFRTKDADAFWEKVMEKVVVVYPIESFDYGMREFAIYDNNGYILQFGQPLKT